MGAKPFHLSLILTTLMSIDTFVVAQTSTHLNFTDFPQWNSADACATECITSATNAQLLKVGCDQPDPPATCVCGTDYQFSYASSNAWWCAFNSCSNAADIDTVTSLLSSYCVGNSAIEAKTSSSPENEATPSAVPGSSPPSTAPSTTEAGSAPSSTGSGQNNNQNVNQSVNVGGSGHGSMPQSDRIALGIGLGVGIPTALFGAWGIWL